MDAGAAAECKRLRWRCRRGMRELDVLLERYLDDVWPGAVATERRAFAALLEWPDPEIAALLFGRRDCNDAAIAAVVAACTQPRRGKGGAGATAGAPAATARGAGPAGDPRLLES